MINLLEFEDLNVRIQDINGNIIEGYVFDYDDGSEEDEDSEYYNEPYILIDKIKPIKGNYFKPYDRVFLRRNEIVSIEEIK